MKPSIQHCLVLILGLTAAASCGTDRSTGPTDYTLSLTPASLTIDKVRVGMRQSTSAGVVSTEP